MALTVEDGTGLSTAESYVSVANADTYHQKHGNPAAWCEATVLEKEAALRQATQYVDGRFGDRFKGIRGSRDQALEWPRVNFFDRDGWEFDTNVVPQEVKDATSELGLRALTGTLEPDLERGGSVLAESLTAGPVSISTTYGSSASSKTEYEMVKYLLRRLLRAQGSVSLSRA